MTLIIHDTVPGGKIPSKALGIVEFTLRWERAEGVSLDSFSLDDKGDTCASFLRARSGVAACRETLGNKLDWIGRCTGEVNFVARIVLSQVGGVVSNRYGMCFFERFLSCKIKKIVQRGSLVAVSHVPRGIRHNAQLLAIKGKYSVLSLYRKILIKFDYFSPAAAVMHKE